MDAPCFPCSSCAVESGGEGGCTAASCKAAGLDLVPRTEEVHVHCLGRGKPGKRTACCQAAELELNWLQGQSRGYSHFTAFFSPALHLCQYNSSLGFRYLNVSKPVHRCSGLSGWVTVMWGRGRERLIRWICKEKFSTQTEPRSGRRKEKQKMQRWRWRRVGRKGKR